MDAMSEATSRTEAMTRLASETRDTLARIADNARARDARRVKLFAFDVERIFRACLEAGRGVTPDHLSLPVLPEVPRDAELLSVYFCPQRNAFLFRVRHASFDVVPEGFELSVVVPDCYRAPTME